MTGEDDEIARALDEFIELSTVLDNSEKHYRDSDDPTDLLFAVATSHSLGRPVPRWAHEGLAKIAMQFYERDGEIDLNQVLRRERERASTLPFRKNAPQ